MSQSWSDVKKDLQLRRDTLVHYSLDNSFPMEPFERFRIQSILGRWETPQRPNNIPTLMKQFCVSAFSYAPLRNNFLSPLIGGLPTRESIAEALSRAFNEPKFMNDSVWTPECLRELASRIQEEHRYDLSSKKFQPRIIAVLLTGSLKLNEELRGGLDNFYDKISNVSAPDAMWRLVTEFSASIAQVGPALVCDFFKEIGFVRYVKVDHHFRNEFPLIVSKNGNCRFSPKKSFIMSQEIADSTGMTPFHLDSILYLWGRYGKQEKAR